eukprot:scaffold14736_cov114-Isochrysis_galbana.AAC.10
MKLPNSPAESVPEASTSSAFHSRSSSRSGTFAGEIPSSSRTALSSWWMVTLPLSASSIRRNNLYQPRMSASAITAFSLRESVTSSSSDAGSTAAITRLNSDATSCLARRTSSAFALCWSHRRSRQDSPSPPTSPLRRKAANSPEVSPPEPVRSIQTHTRRSSPSDSSSGLRYISSRTSRSNSTYEMSPEPSGSIARARLGRAPPAGGGACEPAAPLPPRSPARGPPATQSAPGRSGSSCTADGSRRPASAAPPPAALRSACAPARPRAVATRFPIAPHARPPWPPPAPASCDPGPPAPPAN